VPGALRTGIWDNRSVSVLDRWHRPLGHLRISVTDRCNLRCA
jgi:hypothetical protein